MTRLLQIKNRARSNATALLDFDLFFDLLNKVRRFASLAQFFRTLERLVFLVKLENGDPFQVLTKDTPIKTQANIGGRLLGFPAGRFFSLGLSGQLFSGFCFGSFFLTADDLSSHKSELWGLEGGQSKTSRRTAKRIHSPAFCHGASV
ncbi:hypothetical protein [Rhodopirellula europaea]|uniref:hypothetical protein n=1 Tax=Rhodopirellula europaea TaxID=1263866 RepID=UPI003D2D04A2